MAQQQLTPRTFLNLAQRRFPYFWDLEDEENATLANSGLNIYEDDNNVYVEADMPGMNAEDIELTLDRGILTIKGSRKTEEKEEKKNVKYHSKTITTSFFYRVAVPGQIDESKEPNAKYKDGVLRITLTKSKQGQTKRIQIQK